jgi:hypothetical protein
MSLRKKLRDALAARKADKAAEHRGASQQTLISLNSRAQQGKAHIYAGTVSPKVKGQRRAANKVARKSRRANRR